MDSRDTVVSESTGERSSSLSVHQITVPDLQHVPEAIGSLFGSGRGAEQRELMELDRYAFVAESDRRGTAGVGLAKGR